MANREYYSEVIDEMKKAQGKLCQALYSDLQRLEGAESNGTKVKVQEAYERGVNEAFEAIATLYRMSTEDTQYVFGTTNFHDILKKENHLETLNKIRVFERVELANELQIGDEVINDGSKYVVIEKNEGGKVLLLYPKTIVTVHAYAKKCEKTGRHFDVTEMMKTIEEMKK